MQSRNYHSRLDLSCYRLEHTLEHQGVQRVKGVPVHQPKQTIGIEDSGLPYDGASAGFLDLELEPGTSRKLHLRTESQELTGFDGFDPPKINGVARHQPVGIATPATRSRSAEEKVYKAADLP
jgi:hypothetical protein